jgi:DNA polymerase-3 subunit alpha
MDNTDKVISLIDAANEININIDKPNINKSDYNFESVNETSILYGLGAIKGVGLNAVKHIVEERNKNGPYLNLFDFCERISHNIINIGTLDALIYSGSCDIFNENRLVMKNLLAKAISYGQQKQVSKTSGQQELFENKSDSFSVDNNLDLTKYQVKNTMESRLKILSLEKKVSGLYLSGHPINEFLPEIQSMSIKNIKSYFEKYNINKDPNYSEQITVSGVITNTRLQRTGKDKFINIITIDDSSARLEVVIYPDIYERYQDMIKEDEVLFLSGTLTVDDYNGSLSLKATSIVDIEIVRQKYSKRIELLITPDLSNDKILSQLTNLLEPHKNGKCPLTIKCINETHVVPLNVNDEWHIHPSSILINNLSDLLGRENIIVKYQ